MGLVRGCFDHPSLLLGRLREIRLFSLLGDDLRVSVVISKLRPRFLSFLVGRNDLKWVFGLEINLYSFAVGSSTNCLPGLGGGGVVEVRL